eukprot:SAG11_NODE_28094_length_325_cov_1.176991_1_plen_46_part_10
MESCSSDHVAAGVLAATTNARFGHPTCGTRKSHGQKSAPHGSGGGS